MQQSTNQTPRQWVLNQNGSFRFDAMPIFDFMDSQFISANELKQNLQEVIDWMVLQNLECEVEHPMFPDVYRSLVVLRDVFTTAEFHKPQS